MWSFEAHFDSFLQSYIKNTINTEIYVHLSFKLLNNDRIYSKILNLSIKAYEQKM